MRTVLAHRKAVLGLAALCFLTLGVSGCGGSGSGGATTSQASGRETTNGIATITLHWPVRNAVAGKLIPIASNSATVTFLNAAGVTLQSQLLVRPTGGEAGSGLPTNASFSNLPAGTLTVAVSSFASVDGSGVALAQGTTTVMIVAGQTTPVKLTLGSTIAAVSINPNTLPQMTNVPTLLTAAATDISGNIVVTSQWQWTSSNPAAFTIVSSGSTATITPVAAGVSIITATETESGVSTTVTATGTGGFNGKVLSAPQGVAVDPNTQAIYVASFSGALVKFDAGGNYVATYGTAGIGKLQSAVGVAVDFASNIYVADHGAHDVIKFDSSGNYVATFTGMSAGIILGQITGVTVDAAGNVYAVDADASKVYTFNASGAIVAQFSTLIAANGKGSAGTTGIAHDSAGNLWVSDSNYYCFAEYSPTGSFIAQYGSYGIGVSDGQFSQLSGITIDSKDNIYVTDTGNNDVQEFSKSGVFKGLFGGPGTSAGQFSGVGGVAVNKAGTVYVSDIGGNRLITFTAIP